MAFKDQINQNVGFFIYNREFLFFSGIIGSPQAFNRFQIIPANKSIYIDYETGTFERNCEMNAVLISVYSSK